MRRLRLLVALCIAAFLAVAGTASANVYSVWQTDPDSITAGASGSYAAYFTLGSAIGSGDSITLQGPSGLSWSWSRSDYEVIGNGGGYAVLSDVSVTNGGRTVTIPVPPSLAVASGHQVEVLGHATSPTAAGTYRLAAATSQEPTLVNASDTFTVTAADPAHMELLGGSRQSAPVDTAFGSAPSVKVTDQYGNAVSGATVTFTAPAGGPSATFTGGTGPNQNVGTATTSSLGVAAVSPSAGTIAGHYAIDATVGSVDPVHFLMTNTPGAATGVSAQLLPSSIPADGRSTTTLIATVTDAEGNPVSGRPVDVMLPGNDTWSLSDNRDGTYTTQFSSGTTPGPLPVEVRLWASDGSGFVATQDLTLTQTPLAPSAVTGLASEIGTTTATLSGTVNPRRSGAHYHFVYGVSTAYGSSTPSVDAGSGGATVAASAALSGLQPGTVYHYRLVAAGAGGTTFGADRTFTTGAPPAPSPPPPASSSSQSTTTASTTSPSTTKAKAKRKKKRPRCHYVRRHHRRVKVCPKPKHTHKAKHKATGKTKAKSKKKPAKRR